MRKPSIRLLAAGVLTLGLAVGSASAADAAANVNMALAITRGPWRTSVHTAFQTDNAAGLVVGDSNRAQAVSSHCIACKTVAIAVQVDLASGPVVSIRAVNKAIATTIAGVGDDTCASAYQFIVAPDEMVVFSAQGKAAIAAVEAAVAAEARSGASCAAITAQVGADMNTLGATLFDPASYAPGNPGVHLLPHLNVNRYQDNQQA